MALTGKLPITWGTRAAMAAGTGGGAGVTVNGIVVAATGG